jgi:transposase
MLIKDLNEMQKAYLLHWVRSQDWGTNARLVGNQLCGLQSVRFHQGLWYKEDAVFDSVYDLKSWARVGVNEAPVFTNRFKAA